MATAHAEAALHDDAEGRHIIAAEVASFVQIPEELRVAFPSRPLPRRKLPTPLVYLLGPVAVGYTWGYVRRNLGHPFAVDNSRGRDRRPTSRDADGIPFNSQPRSEPQSRSPRCDPWPANWWSLAASR